MKKFFYCLVFILAFSTTQGQQQTPLLSDGMEVVVTPMPFNSDQGEFVAGLINDRLYFCKLSLNESRRGKGLYDYFYVNTHKDQLQVFNDDVLSGNYQNGWFCYSALQKRIILTQTNVDHPTIKVKLKRIKELGLRLEVCSITDWQRGGSNRKPLFPYMSTNHGYPAISPDGKILVFAQKNDENRSDLFICYRKDQEWSTPQLMLINDAEDDVYPGFTPEGDLIFASSRDGGLGGLDLYCSSRKGTRFLAPKNLGAKINSEDDDFGLVMENSNKGYFTSSRGGNDDVYKLEIEFSEVKRSFTFVDIRTKDPVVGLSVDLINVKGELMASMGSDSKGMVSLSGDLGKNSFIKIQGRNYYGLSLPVTSKDSIIYMVGRRYVDYTFVDHQSGEKLDSVTIDMDGETTEVKGGRLVRLIRDVKQLIATAPDYLRHRIRFDKKQTEGVLFDTISMHRIGSTSSVTLENVYYDFGLWDLKQSSTSSLDELISLMKDNTEICVEIGSHTDSRGSEGFNYELSRKRSQSIVAYLTSHGIDRNRLISKGYGETRLLSRHGGDSRISESEHQLDRRSEFKVLTSKELLVESGATDRTLNNWVIQLMATKKPLTSSEIEAIESGGSVIYENLVGSWFKYYIGGFSSYEQCKKFLRDNPSVRGFVTKLNK